MKKNVRDILSIGVLAATISPSFASETPEDPYFWLEDVQGKQSLDWVESQNALSVERLEKDPRFASIYSKLQTIYDDPKRIPHGELRGDYVYNFWRDQKNIQGVYRRTSRAEYAKDEPRWETLLDLDLLSKKEGKTWVYKGIRCFVGDKNLCIITLSNGGGDASELREFDLSKKTFVQKNAFVVPEAKSSSLWVDKNHLLVASNWGEDSVTHSGYPRTFRLWKRGTAVESAPLVFEGKKEDVSVGATRPQTPNADFTLFERSLDFYTSEKHVKFDNEAQTRLLDLPVSFEHWGFFGDFILFKNRNAWEKTIAGSLLAFDVKSWKSGKKDDLIKVLWSPDEISSLEGVVVSKSRVLLNYVRNVKSEALSFRIKDGVWESRPLDLPRDGVISFWSANHESEVLFMGFESFLQPETVYLLDLSKESYVPLKKLNEYFDASKYVTEQYKAKSNDGTMVPYFVVRRIDMLLDGRSPALLYGYGGFEVTLTPFYSATMGTQWLEKGGVYVLSNIRGGGEFGPAWHQAALKEKRQNAYDDFHAIAEDLARRKIASAEKIAIEGGSNGGLLVGVAFTQRPDLYKAVVCQVPLLDMMRFHKLLAGASWMGEYGNPDVPEEREYIRKYSPYQNVFSNVKYPEVYFFTSTQDDRVHPGHARKMVARMKEQGHPVIYFENTQGGHGGAANLKQKARIDAMKWVYLMQKLGMSP